MMQSSSARPVSVYDVEEADDEVFSSKSSGSVEGHMMPYLVVLYTVTASGCCKVTKKIRC